MYPDGVWCALSCATYISTALVLVSSGVAENAAVKAQKRSRPCWVRFRYPSLWYGLPVTWFGSAAVVAAKYCCALAQHTYTNPGVYDVRAS